MGCAAARALHPQRHSRAPRCRGFTVIELVVTLTVLGIIVTLAVPRYLGARRDALVAEADHVLNELRNVAWSHRIREGTWEGVTAANMASLFGFVPPDDAVGCWDYGLAADGTAAELQLRATGDNTPARCEPANGVTITLTLTGEGSATRTVAFP